ncbi:MAG: sodium:solute symporter family transporter [Pirellulaceae bacterium]
MGIADFVVFIAFVVAVIFVGLWKSSGEETHGEHGAQDYFLAGRGLTWWLIGFSLIAANISTEQFVGMSGQAANWLGMAIASYEWMAAVTLVIVAFIFLPTFLRSGIYTIPEFLEYRYNAFARLVMAVATLVILVGVPTASVIYSGAKVITGNFQGVIVAGFDLGDITVGCWIIGTLSAVYVFAGGLKACAWADLLQGTGLIAGGVVVLYFGLTFLGEARPEELIKTARNQEVTVASLQDAGAMQRFWDLNKGPLPDGKTHMVRPLSDPTIPWSALVVGLWIPNFFYWGLNQYITQRTLGSKSLAEGQRGIVFAALLKLVIPFIVVIPGILAFNLFHSHLQDDAVNRNAQVLAEKTPELYRSLSEGMKPAADQVRNANILKQIDADIAAARTASSAIQLYKFGAAFAALHPEDAAAIADFNGRQLAGKFAQKGRVEAAATPAVLADDTATFVTAAQDRLGESVAVEELVAHDYDNAFPTLIRELLPVGNGIKGFVLAAIFGAVVSTLAAMLNSASTIATMDLYRKIHKNASQFTLVTVGRIWVVVFVLIAMCIAPFLGHPRFGGIFNFIQEFQGFISSGILAIFLFGLLVHRAPRMVGVIGLVLNPLLYGLLKWFAPQIAFLDRMAICFFVIIGVLSLITWLWPLKQPVDLPVNPAMNMESSRGAKAFGVVVVLLTVVLYVVFW